MKRILTALLAAALLLALVSFPAAAAGTARFTLSGPSTARPGDTITVTLSVQGQYSAHTLDLRVFFDNTSFRYKSQTNGSALDQAGGMVISDINSEGNAVSLGVLMVMNPMTVQGELLKMTFEVLSTASPRPAFTIGVQKFSYLPVGDTVETPVTFTTSDLTVAISGGTGSGTTNPPSMTPTPIQTPKPKTPAPTPKPKTPGPTGTPRPAATLPGTGHETDRPGGNTGTPGKETPKPGEKTSQPYQPAGTPAPTKTPGPATEAPADRTAAPDTTEQIPDQTETIDPGLATDIPIDVDVRTASPAESETLATPQPGGNDPEGTDPETPRTNNDGTLKTVLIAAAAVLAAGLAALCIVLGVRSKKQNKKE